jgi:hypothetical protein
MLIRTTLISTQNANQYIRIIKITLAIIITPFISNYISYSSFSRYIVKAMYSILIILNSFTNNKN